MTEWAIDHQDIKIMQGDARTRLAELADESVHCIVTSPPFWGLRDYGHDEQIGLEETPEEWCARLVDVFRECRRVLRSDGVFWLEVGDTYNNRAVSRLSSHQGGLGFTNEGIETSWADHTKNGSTRMSISDGDLKEKDLIGAPWMLAFALRADGWWLRSDTIWARPNPMPESVTDRPTKAHSYVFLLTKSPRYFYDSDAIRTDAKWTRENDPKWNDARRARVQQQGAGMRHAEDGGFSGWDSSQGANAKSVWTIATEATPFAHFATMPQALAEKCIKAGTSEYGRCAQCGAPWDRITERITVREQARADMGRKTTIDAKAAQGVQHLSVSNSHNGEGTTKITHLGWQPTCDCGCGVVDPCVVLDPFMGSGTTALVARRLGRHSVGVELNAEYVAIAADRLKQMSLL